MQQQCKRFAGATRRVLEHLTIAIGIAECEDRATADCAEYADRFSGTVIDEIEAGLAHQNGLAVAHFVLQLLFCAHHPVGRNTVGFGHPHAHEFSRAARDDPDFETIRPQQIEQFELWLIHQFGVGPIECWVLRTREPVANRLVVFVGRHATVGDRDHLKKRLAVLRESRSVVREKRPERGIFLPIRMPGRGGLQLFDHERQLERHGLLAPERTVVIEYRDACLRRHIGSGPFARYVGEELEDGGTRRAVLPRGQRRCRWLIGKRLLRGRCRGPRRWSFVTGTGAQNHARENEDSRQPSRPQVIFEEAH
ncbi:hypothetical protein LMG27177_07483 [Paraburkholderia fynbosensis]|uniref:Uncharacterized protein n=1 Tax=Paraburkholderia fynbosensis TaxID=1200993 RepID=A0A6J5H5F6_9BURK|nr:hypothetical protein LMG27177_07483 [Paraburkholderia fynbosensis]